MAKLFMLIDDDHDDAELFGEALSVVAPTIVFHYAENSSIAFDFLSNSQNQKPDLIFLDLNMPEMNGWQCLRKLKEDSQLKNIPVVMYTTSSYQKDKDTARELGAIGFLTKPSEFKNLKKILEQIIRHLEVDIEKFLSTPS